MRQTQSRSPVVLRPIIAVIAEVLRTKAVSSEAAISHLPQPEDPNDRDMIETWAGLRSSDE